MSTQMIKALWRVLNDHLFWRALCEITNKERMLYFGPLVGQSSRGSKNVFTDEKYSVGVNHQLPVYTHLEAFWNISDIIQIHKLVLDLDQ